MNAYSLPLSSDLGLLLPYLENSPNNNKIREHEMLPRKADGNYGASYVQPSAIFCPMHPRYACLAC